MYTFILFFILLLGSHFMGYLLVSCYFITEKLVTFNFRLILCTLMKNWKIKYLNLVSNNHIPLGVVNHMVPSMLLIFIMNQTDGFSFLMFFITAFTLQFDGLIFNLLGVIHFNEHLWSMLILSGWVLYIIF